MIFEIRLAIAVFFGSTRGRKRYLQAATTYYYLCKTIAFIPNKSQIKRECPELNGTPANFIYILLPFVLLSLVAFDAAFSHMHVFGPLIVRRPVKITANTHYFRIGQE